MTFGYNYLNAHLKMYSPIFRLYSVSFKSWMKLYSLILKQLENRLINCK